MKLTNGKHAVIDRRKLSEYALCVEHDEGRHKATLFQRLPGFGPEDVDELVRALLAAAETGEAVPGRVDHYGRRYTVDFSMMGLKGTASVRSVWILRPGKTCPELGTC